MGLAEPPIDQQTAALAGAIDRALAMPRPRPAMADLACEVTFAREWGLYEELAAA